MTTNMVAGYIDAVLNNPIILRRVVADGQAEWRRKMLRDFRGLPVNDDIANQAFRFIRAQQRIKDHGLDAAAILDALEISEPHIPTETEIANGWAIESGSSFEGKQQFYGDKTPEQILRELADRDVRE